jgi:hypothetical protein
MVGVVFFWLLWFAAAWCIVRWLLNHYGMW